MTTSAPADHEKPSLTKLLNTYELNTQKDLQPDDRHRAFSRSPAPALLVAAKATDKSHDPKLELPRMWETTLFRLKDCQLYDGSALSAAKFRSATSLTPHKFAQAWCEAAGSPWRYFHLRDNATHKQLAGAMCGYWAVKVEHWKALRDRDITREVVQRAGAQGLKDAKKLVDEELAHVIPVGAESKDYFNLLSNLKVVVNPDCAEHYWKTVCSCEVALSMPIRSEVSLKHFFVQAFDIQMIQCDKAFLYTGTDDSAVHFKVNNAEGQEPYEYAEETADDLFSSCPFWELTGSKRDLVNAMLRYWAHEMRGIRKRCKTRREARTRATERQAAAENARMIDTETGIARRVNLHENRSEDPLCRYVKFPGPQPGHQHTLVLYAKFGKSSPTEFGYELIRVTPCHEACVAGGREPAIPDIWSLVGDVYKKDMARAKAVKAEW